MVELNVREQILNICKSPTIQRAWATNQYLEVHGWVFDIATGLIKDLGISRQIWDNYENVYRLDASELAYQQEQ
ncbi:MAG: carbonic anhydrase, partial [Chloroflexales bacterium]|nr:carbonic anhydrase [Chloroflexales bacterium]